MSRSYHILKKKERTTGVIEEPRKNDAIVLIIKEEVFAVPEWQIKEVRRRITDFSSKPESMIHEDVFLGMLDEEYP
jgi:hypothetical protein